MFGINHGTNTIGLKKQFDSIKQQFRNTDLVNLPNNFSILMFTDDLAYRQLPQELKNYSYERHLEDLKKGNKPKGSIINLNDSSINAHVLFKIIMEEFWKHPIDFSIIDIGAQYGSFSMELASFIKQNKQKNKIFAFDCGIASNFSLFNIKLNLLDDIIKFEKKAITNKSIKQIVYYDIEHSEDNHIIKRDGVELPSYLVDGITLDNYFANNKEKLIIKIDTQGAEPLVFQGMSKILSLKPIIFFEFTPWTMSFLSVTPSEFLKSIPEDYTIFSFWPKSNIITRIEKDQYEHFIQLVSESEDKWTDLFIINRSTEIYNNIINRIQKAINFKQY